MINHFRTLLINLPASTIKKYSNIYVDEYFLPVKLNNFLQTIDNFIFSDLSIKDRIMLSNDILPIIHTPELHYFTLVFDSRITYLDKINSYNIYTSRDKALLIDLINKLNNKSHILPFDENNLFLWDKYQLDLDSLKDAYFSKDGILKLGSFVISYIYQIEKARAG